MKNYYQQKKGGWKLDPVIYAKTVAQIRCYRIYRRQAEAEIASDAGYGMTLRESGNAGPDTIHTGPDTIHTGPDTIYSSRSAAAQYVQIIDQALVDYVPEAYRMAVFSHVVDRATYNDLEEQHFISTSTMKRYTQVFIWGVAKGLGEVMPEGQQNAES